MEKFIWIDPTIIEEPPSRARSYLSDEELARLKASIEKEGVKDPIKVVHTRDGRWILADGGHRVDIACELRLEKIPAIIVGETEIDAAKSSLISSIRGRGDWVSISDTCYWLCSHANMTHEEIASLLGLSRPVITKILSVAKLGTKASETLRSYTDDLEVFYEVSRIESVETQERLVGKIIAQRWGRRETRTFMEEFVKYKKKGEDDLGAFFKASQSTRRLHRARNVCGICDLVFEDPKILSFIRACPTCLEAVQKVRAQMHE